MNGMGMGGGDRWWSIEELGEGASVVRSKTGVHGHGVDREVWVLRVGSDTHDGSKSNPSPPSPIVLLYHVYRACRQDVTDYQINNPSSTHSPTPSSSEINKQPNSPLSKPNPYPLLPIPKGKRQHQPRSPISPIIKTTGKKRKYATGPKNERGGRRNERGGRRNERGRGNWRLKRGNRKWGGGRDGLLRR
jgi:hypothetical protein